jgi:hypothetical protein
VLEAAALEPTGDPESDDEEEQHDGLIGQFGQRNVEKPYERRSGEKTEPGDADERTDRGGDGREDRSDF